MKKPIIYSYHNYQDYISDMVGFLKSNDKSLNNKKMATILDITPSYFSMILNKKREVSGELILKFSELFKLSDQETSFLELLISFNTAKGDLNKSKFLERMKGFKKYRELNPVESAWHSYMSNWLNVVIREMTALDDFSSDPKWIQSQLSFPASLEDVKKSLDFLIKNKIVKQDEQGKYLKPDYQISCMDSVYRNALISFHKQFLELASQAATYIDTDHRRLLGHCVALKQENVEEAKKIIEEAYARLRGLQDSNDESDSVYFMELALFPLTNGGSGENN
jgi:uncharacterized protein (TIGR02147 family)